MSIPDAPLTPSQSRSRRSIKPPTSTDVLKANTSNTSASSRRKKAAVSKARENGPSASHGITDSVNDDSKTTQHARSSHGKLLSFPGNRSEVEALTDRSFDLESDIYSSANLESSITDSDELRSTPEYARHETRDQDIYLDELCQPHGDYDELTSNNSKYSPAQGTSSVSSTTKLTSGSDWQFHASSLRFRLNGRTILMRGAQVLTILFIILFIPKISTYGKDLSASFPSLFHPIEASTIQRRLSKLESDISVLQRHSVDIDYQALKKLQQILPDAIALRRRNGKPHIPGDFWQALRDKILSDDILSSIFVQTLSYTDETGDPTTHGAQAQKLWDRFSKENEQKIRQLSDEKLTDQFPKLLRENDIISKAEVIEMIRKNWDENKASIDNEMKHFTARLKRSMQQSVLQSNMSAQHLKTLAAEILNFIPSAQLQAAAHVNIQNNVKYGSMKTNHLSMWTGALIDARNTSPNYVFPSQARIWFYERWARALMSNPVPLPKPAEEALKKWEEQGDCWCSSAQNGRGFGPSLGVLLGNKIYPEEIVVEHIPAALALQPGATPRNLELLAFIEDPKIEATIRQESERLFSEIASEAHDNLKGYVRIAAWIYDLNAPLNIQTHEIPLSLMEYGTDTSKVIVRSKTNWGAGNVNYTCFYRVRLHGPIAELSEP
ncbi:/spindle pole body-associated protein sad1 [Blumeria hordei DH14]|uniref:/spindle pole body-associated protein sad1 n=1 Tax=Blumeria graminis f. sp. hordei (strain DH14) TaxID=546991 RepID=N1J7K3_BLUG1|nr:/spindle pole body-associated protein sad1 [Blumeria hordei DH14]